MRVLIVLSTLTGLSQAAVVAPRQAVSPSEVTITSTSLSTVTNTITTAYPVITTATTCNADSVIPKGTCSAGAVWSLTGGNYYSQQCSASLVGGTNIRAYVEPVGSAATSICVSICNALNNLKTPASSCNGIVFTTIGALYQCFLRNGAVTQAPAVSSVFNIVQYTTNPCVVTSTALQTDISYETVTSTIEVVYTSTIAPSAAASTSVVTISSAETTTSTSTSDIPSAAATTSTSEIPSAAASTSVIVISSTDTTTSTSEISAPATTLIPTIPSTNTTTSTSEIPSSATTTLIPILSPTNATNTTTITSQTSAAAPTLVYTNSSISVSTTTSPILSSALGNEREKRYRSYHTGVIYSAGALPLNEITGWRVGESEVWSASSLREANWFESTEERGDLALICGGVRDNPFAWDNLSREEEEEERKRSLDYMHQENHVLGLVPRAGDEKGNPKEDRIVTV
ncbi:hypothetical protein BGAL_0264g00140 [Botrytis galanthina]|uniref:Apple domain-containing protein n=1 Tax=Botrytis galanthina TaxID=278940 RepID=A0A4S8QSH2_9HELO|nr:hypothetical protein BGAL_0264g00140 [Botrytis galanthina]